MPTTIAEIHEAARDFFERIQEPDFVKTLKLNKEGERRLLPIFGAFLLGRFNNVRREVTVNLGCNRDGRVDYEVSGVAIELAVRRPKTTSASLSAAVNSTEAKKLLRYPGRAALILMDFSHSPLSEDKLEAFRDWPSLGKGNYNRWPFNVIYVYSDTESGQTNSVLKNIRV